MLAQLFVLQALVGLYPKLVEIMRSSGQRFGTRLQIRGGGYWFEMSGNRSLLLHVGNTQPIEIAIPTTDSTLTVTVENPKTIYISSDTNKPMTDDADLYVNYPSSQRPEFMNFAAKIRKLRPPEPYFETDTALVPMYRTSWGRVPQHYWQYHFWLYWGQDNKFAIDDPTVLATHVRHYSNTNDEPIIRFIKLLFTKMPPGYWGRVYAHPFKRLRHDPLKLRSGFKIYQHQEDFDSIALEKTSITSRDSIGPTVGYSNVGKNISFESEITNCEENTRTPTLGTTPWSRYCKIILSSNLS